MKTIESILNLEVLLHFHAREGRFDPASPVAATAIMQLLDAGMLERDKDCYATTPKGRFYIRHLLNTSFPLTTYYIVPTTK